MTKKPRPQGPAIQLTKQDMKVLVALTVLTFATIVYVSAHQTAPSYDPPPPTEGLNSPIETPQPVKAAADGPVEVAPRSVEKAAAASSTCGGACGSPTCGAKTGGSCGCGG